jgi:hypothetical protein
MIKAYQVVTCLTIFIARNKRFRRSFNYLGCILDGNAVYIWKAKLGITYIRLSWSGSRLFQCHSKEYLRSKEDTHYQKVTLFP